jgi:hypothetical protein
MTALKSSVLVALLGAVGVGDQVLSLVVQAPRDVLPHTAVGLPMPKTPFPGQKKPPCEPRMQRAILGECWVRVGTEKPPCGPTAYDYEEGCYMPVYESPRKPI